MREGGAITFSADQISELFLSSRQDKDKYGDSLRDIFVSWGKCIYLSVQVK